ncbi:MAG TPA: tetratricopeptide repeat protein, partial [Vicinamibacterales bacterium]|nr:tetratricopeptide repeat protein [Vicinamibacterales bacterium]
VGWVLYFAKRYEDALRQYDRTLRIDPSYVQAHWRLGTAYAAVNRLDDAVAELDRVVGLTGRSTSSLAWLGLIDAVAGKRTDAEAVLGELLTRARDQYVTPAGVALIYAQLRDRDQAFGWLEKAFEERSNALAYLAVDPMYDPLRSDPRFDNLRQRVGLEEVR